MKVKLYSPRELDKRLSSGYIGQVNVIERRNLPKWAWRYYDLSRWYYKKLARHRRQVTYIGKHPYDPRITIVTVEYDGETWRFPVQFIKKYYK